MFEQMNVRGSIASRRKAVKGVSYLKARLSLPSGRCPIATTYAWVIVRVFSKHERKSNHDPLHFIERDLVSRSVVELSCARRLVRRDGLRILDCAAVFQVRRDACCPKSMAASGIGEAGSSRAPLHHS